MNWVAISAIAEFCGGVAVLFTFIYLTIQVRKNSNAIQQQIREATVQMMESRGDTLINFFSLGINDEKALAIFSGFFKGRIWIRHASGSL